MGEVQSRRISIHVLLLSRCSPQPHCLPAPITCGVGVAPPPPKKPICKGELRDPLEEAHSTVCNYKLLFSVATRARDHTSHLHHVAEGRNVTRRGNRHCHNSHLYCDILPTPPTTQSGFSNFFRMRAMAPG